MLENLLGKDIIMQYPTSSTNDAYDGKEHDITSVRLRSIVINNKKFYVLDYVDRDLNNKLMITLLTEDFRKVPLDDYVSFQLYLEEHKKELQREKMSILPDKISCTNITKFDDLGKDEPVVDSSIEPVTDDDVIDIDKISIDNDRVGYLNSLLGLKTQTQTVRQPIDHNRKTSLTIYNKDDEYFITEADASKIKEVKYIEETGNTIDGYIKLTEVQVRFLKNKYNVTIKELIINNTVNNDGKVNIIVYYDTEGNMYLSKDSASKLPLKTEKPVNGYVKITEQQLRYLNVKFNVINKQLNNVNTNTPNVSPIKIGDDRGLNIQGSPIPLSINARDLSIIDHVIYVMPNEKFFNIEACRLIRDNKSGQRYFIKKEDYFTILKDLYKNCEYSDYLEIIDIEEYEDRIKNQLLSEIIIENIVDKDKFMEHVEDVKKIIIGKYPDVKLEDITTIQDMINLLFRSNYEDSENLRDHCCSLEILAKDCTLVSTDQYVDEDGNIKKKS